ncbi:hypothetical protein D3C72_1281340 [compost metagenome]
MAGSALNCASTGRPASSKANATSSSAPARWLTGSPSGSCVPASAGRSSKAPASAATAITATCIHAPGSASTAPPAAAMMAMRTGPRHSVRAMPHTACATTATATSLSPCSTPGAAAMP